MHTLAVLVALVSVGACSEPPRTGPGISGGVARLRRGAMRMLAVLVALVAVGACSEAPRTGPGISGGVARLELPLVTRFDVDLLLVVDNSPGSAPVRTRMLAAYRRFAEVLATFPNGVPSLHVGAITSDVGTRGALDTGDGPAIGSGRGACTSDGDRGELRRAPAVTDNFLVDDVRLDGTRHRNYTGSLGDALVQLADAGDAGCSYPRPLEALRRALENPANAGFRRTGAYLVVAFLTNSDDCSFASAAFTGGDLDRARCTRDADALVAVDDYAAALRATTTDPADVLVLAGLALPEVPCADAAEAPRLGAFLARFPGRGHALSICDRDLGPLVAPIAELEKTWLGAPCFSAPLLDVDPATDGLQVDCASWYRYSSGGAVVEELLPACRGTAPGPCWQIRRDPVVCPGPGESVAFRDHRRGFDVAAGARVVIECVSQFGAP